MLLVEEQQTDLLPSWLPTSISMCREEPDRLQFPTASTAAAAATNDSTNTNTPTTIPRFFASIRLLDPDQTKASVFCHSAYCSVRGPPCPSDPPALPSQSTEDMLDSVNPR